MVMIDSLPDEIICLFFHFFCFKDQCGMSCLNKHFNSISKKENSLSSDYGIPKSVPNTGLIRISQMRIKYLDLSECNGITNNGLIRISQMQLQNLNLSGCHKITNTGLMHLKDMPLQSLNL